MPRKLKGTITSWNDEKGFGFITPKSGDKKVFIHINSIRDRSRRPEIGQLVTYTLSTDKQGRQCADKCTLSVSLFSKAINQSSSIIYSLIPYVSAIAFFSVVALAVYMEKIPPFIFVFYILFSLITFIIYSVDKSAARKGNWRTQESSLHLLSLAGGWPGALLAQKMINHKTRKQPFRTIFWVTVFVNGAVFIWLLTPNGAEVLKTVIDSIVWGLTTGTT